MQANESHPIQTEPQDMPDIREEENDELMLSEDEITSLGKAQLADKLEEFLKLEDIQSFSGMVRTIKDRFDELVKEEYQLKLKRFLQDGGIESDFTPAPDPLDKKIESLYKIFNKKKVGQREQKEKTAQENLSTKKLIIEELKELLKGADSFSKSYNKFQALQSKWRSTGDVPQKDVRTLRENYHFLVGKFYDIVKISNELRELDRKKNLELKTELCEKAERLIEEPSLKKSLDGLRFLQETWRETGLLSRELNDTLGQRFKAVADKLYERKKEHTILLKQQQENNLAVKQALCLALETLSVSDLSSLKACRDASGKAEAIWAEWQKTGFVPKSDKGECWKRFKKARQHFYDTLDLFYANQRREFGQNLQKKTDLCLRAEAIQESTDWSSSAEELKKLQVEWKSIGSVSYKDSDKIWNRFRKACDYFFERRTLHLEAKENTLRGNVQAKESLVSRMESLQPSAELSQSLEELKKTQEEWTALGEVPLRENDRLNNAFGKAVENFIERTRVLTPVEDKIFYRLKYEQLLKYPQGQEKLKKLRSEIQVKINKLQTEVNQLENNLSFFGKSKNSSPIIVEYEQKLLESKQQVQELQRELKYIPSI